MTKLIWDASGSRSNNAGIDRGVFYPKNGTGVVWNGLLSVNERTEDLLPKATYIDGKQTELKLGSYAADLSAFTYPKEFEECDGYAKLTRGQKQPTFNLAYRKELSLGYQLHLVYNALATPTEENFKSVNSVEEITNFSWSITTTPIVISGNRPSAHLVIDTTKADPSVVAAIENVLYGSTFSDPKFPLVQEVLAMFKQGL